MGWGQNPPSVAAPCGFAGCGPRLWRGVARGYPVYPYPRIATATYTYTVHGKEVFGAPPARLWPFRLRAGHRTARRDMTQATPNSDRTHTENHVLTEHRTIYIYATHTHTQIHTYKYNTQTPGIHSTIGTRHTAWLRVQERTQGTGIHAARQIYVSSGPRGACKRC